MPEVRSIAVGRLLTDPTLEKAPLDALSSGENLAPFLGAFPLIHRTEHER